MSTTTLSSPHVIRIRRALVPGLFAILILTTLALIAGIILSRLSSTTCDGYQVDRIPVVKDFIRPILVPILPTAATHLVLFEPPILASMVASEQSVLSIPVPTPPL